MNSYYLPLLLLNIISMQTIGMNALLYKKVLGDSYFLMRSFQDRSVVFTAKDLFFQLCRTAQNKNLKTRDIISHAHIDSTKLINGLNDHANVALEASAIWTLIKRIPWTGKYDGDGIYEVNIGGHELELRTRKILPDHIKLFSDQKFLKAQHDLDEFEKFKQLLASREQGN
jgi:hypothetical protein